MNDFTPFVDYLFSLSVLGHVSKDTTDFWSDVLMSDKGDDGAREINTYLGKILSGVQTFGSSYAETQRIYKRAVGRGSA